jgi:hypothetical protein
MDGMLSFFYEFFGQFLGGIWTAISNIFVGIVEMFNFPKYVSIVNSHTSELGGMAWVYAIIGMLVIIGLLCLIGYVVFVSLKKFIRFRSKVSSTNDLIEEVNALNREVMRLNLEKDKILSMKVSQIGLNPNEISELTGEEMETLTGHEDTPIGENESRFFKLSKIDAEWADYVPPVYDNTITLPEICDRFRNFACSRLGLYYDIKIIRLFMASFASTRLIILQGISGTGKTSLPYAFGKFLQNDAIITSIQPSWRDRSELFGYFNEFTKRYNETELLRAMYEATYNENIYLTILDEMNIARVEYYFAEMLSIMEMPDADEWRIEIVPSSWENDPIKLTDGKLTIPQNIWYIGTANNDDSTFSVSDKVYDRALTINIDNKGIPFVAPDTPPSRISFSAVDALYKQAVLDHPMEERYLNMIEDLDSYVIKKFRVAFGNRIMKQMKVFVPAYVACGGTVVEAIDHILATKVFRKFESLNLALIRDEIKGLINYLDTLFGKGKMVSCIEFLDRLQRTY